MNNNSDGKIIAFGAGNFFLERRENIEKNYDIVAFCDNDEKKWGGEKLLLR